MKTGAELPRSWQEPGDLACQSQKEGHRVAQVQVTVDCVPLPGLSSPPPDSWLPIAASVTV